MQKLYFSFFFFLFLFCLYDLVIRRKERGYILLVPCSHTFCLSSLIDCFICFASFFIAPNLEDLSSSGALVYYVVYSGIELSTLFLLPNDF